MQNISPALLQIEPTALSASFEPTIIPTVDPPRVPEAASGLNVNHCRNPSCGNYGVPALAFARIKPGPNGATAVSDMYVVTQTGSGGEPAIKCKSCGVKTILRSNRAIVEEFERITAYLRPAMTGCMTVGCDHLGMPLEDGLALGIYSRHQATKTGAVRWRCKACRKTFTTGSRPRKQSKPHENKTVFGMLVNKAPIRAIARVTDLDPHTVYDKIDFIRDQCLMFVADRERALPTLPFKRLWISVDRQDYTVNWTNRKNRRNVMLTMVGSAENKTGYCFGLHLAYDPKMSPAGVELAAAAVGENEIPRAFRRHARVWLQEDVEDKEIIQARRAEERQAKMRALIARAAVASVAPIGQIPATEQDAASPQAADGEADDVPIEGEVVETIDSQVRKLPNRGMQVHVEYTAMAHFEFLRRQLAGARRIRFFMDGDFALTHGVLSVFADDVKAHRVDAFVVKIAKGLNIDEKRSAIKASRDYVDNWREQMGKTGWSRSKVILFLIMYEVHRIRAGGDPWLVYPFHTINEVDKEIRCLTKAFDDDDDTRVAFLFRRASLFGIDRVFMQLRRMLMMLERPIPTAAGKGRVWHGYTCYNPEIIQKLLDIYRVYYNYCAVGEDGRTPAMRMGLAKGPVRREDILYYRASVAGKVPADPPVASHVQAA